MRKFVCAAFLTVAAFGLATAEELTVQIFKCDADKGCIMYKKIVGTGKTAKVDDDDKGTVVDLVKGAKIYKGKKDADDKKKTIDGDEIEKGLSDAMFSSDMFKDKGVRATIFIADDGADKGKVTKIRVMAAGKKKAAN